MMVNNEKNQITTDSKNDDLTELLSNPFGTAEIGTEDKHPQTENPQTSLDSLPKDHQEKAREIANQITISKPESIVQFGTAAQQKLTTFSDSMLNHVQQKDSGPIGDVLKDLMKKLDQVNPDELIIEKKNVISRLFSKLSSSVHEVLSKYQKIGAQVDKIGVRLEKSKETLLFDINMLDQLFDKNKEYYDALNIYIAAGEWKLNEIRNETIPDLKAKTKKIDEDGMLVQQVHDMVQFADRLEKRIHDLKLSRQITIQSAPQIRMIQNMNHTLVEKIQSSILTAIPLWKNQITIALTLFRQKKAVDAQKQVSKTTNELLMKNSEMLKTNSIDTAKENEKGIVDIETLKKTQENLISTIEETIHIQSEGRKKRKEAEKVLLNMESEMKQKLLEWK